MKFKHHRRAKICENKETEENDDGEKPAASGGVAARRWQLLSLEILAK